MNEKAFGLIKTECKALSDVSPIVKAIWIYGSSTTRDKIKKESDIDILILIDDTKPVQEETLQRIEFLFRVIKEKMDKKGLKLHFQPLKYLTNWWELVRHGEPWTITSLRHIQILYDPSEYIYLLHKLLEKGQLYSTDEKAEKLLLRANQFINDNREIMLNKIPFQILMSMTESVQTILMYFDRFPPDPKNVSKELKALTKTNPMITEKLIAEYDEVYQLVSKITRGTLSEFSGHDFDRYYSLSKRFITEVEDILIMLEKEKKENDMSDAFKNCMSLCDKALKKSGRSVPSDPENKIIQFKKYFIDTGLIDVNHYTTLKELYEYCSSKEKRVELEKDKYLDRIHVKTLRLAIEDVAGVK